MNTALMKKETADIVSEKLYLFAFLAQLVVVMGVLFAALLYTSIAAPETSSFVETQRPRLGIIGSDRGIETVLGESLELIPVRGEAFQIMESLNLVGVLEINSRRDFTLYLDNTQLLSGYADTEVTDALEQRRKELERELLEEQTGDADTVLTPIRLAVNQVGGSGDKQPPEFVVVMYALLIPFILLLPTFLATNMVTDSIVGEKERKTYEVLVASPLSKGEIIVSKITPILAIAMIQSLFWILLLNAKTTPVYNIGLLMLLLFIINIIFIGLGVLISAFSNTLKESNLSVTLTILFASITMFAPLPLKSQIQALNPIVLMTKLASNPAVPASALLPLIPLTLLAAVILLAGRTALTRIETLRL